MKRTLCLIMLALFVGGVLGCKGNGKTEPKKTNGDTTPKTEKKDETGK